MVSRRMIAAAAAIACVGGMAIAAVAPGVAHASTAGQGTAGHGAAAPRGPLPPHVFAPYYFNTADTLAATSKASGAKYLTLAFLQTAKPGSCTVDWNGDPSMPVGKTYAAGIAAVQAAGGNVVPSFGGASADSADEELADSCHSVPAIAGQYEKVITTYHVTRLDLDTEEDSLNNYAGIDRRNKAIALVEQWAQSTHRAVQFVYTIPTNTTGTDQGGSYVLQNALANGAQIAVVNIMTFDYYDNLPHEMADNTEGAAQQLYDRLHGLYPGKTPSQLWGMIGVTEDLGVDDFGPAETFTLADARTVEHWAAARGLAELSFWNVEDDNTAGSQQKQSPYEYSRILEPFTSSAPAQRTALDAPPAATGALDPARGNMRSVSCPSPSFCVAVDESGNNALRWDGTGWSAPVSIDPGGTRVEITSVSCASRSFCAAVDTRGRVMTWNGTSWSRPRAVDADGAGFTSVSCPSASFCVAADGDGDALRWNGARWTAPDRVDDSGSSLQSVSCASASFCAAVDWNGNALTWNGSSWTTPAVSCPDSTAGGAGTCYTTGRFVDPRTGVLDSVSCPDASFCAAVDGNGNALAGRPGAWRAGPVKIDPIAGLLTSVSCASPVFCAAVDANGRALTWNGRSWSVPSWSAANPVDPGGGGLAGVSCPTASFCVAVDGNGNALRWNGARWSAPARADAAGLAGVSCASAAFCAAVAGDGDAVATWNGARRWARVLADRAGGGLTGVSCFAGGCVAVDFAGNAMVFCPPRPAGAALRAPAWGGRATSDRPAR